MADLEDFKETITHSGGVLPLHATDAQIQEVIESVQKRLMGEYAGAFGRTVPRLVGERQVVKGTHLHRTMLVDENGNAEAVYVDYAEGTVIRGEN
jgi:hypothetical protein